MIKLFRAFNPQTIFIVILFGLILKVGYFIYPPSYIIGNHEWLFQWLMSKTNQYFSINPYFMSGIGILSLIVQSLLVNRLATEYKLFGTDSFIPAALFLIISSFIPSWNTLSAPLVANWFILLLFNNLLRLQQTSMPKKLLFNSGMLVTVAGLIYYPAFLYVILIWWSISIVQSFNIKNYIISFLGLLMPLYFIASIIYILDIPIKSYFIQKLVLNFPINNLSKTNILAILTIGLLIIFSFLSLNNHLDKVVESIKKIWWIIIVNIFISSLIALFNVDKDPNFWFFCIAPVTLLVSSIWLTDTNIWIKRSLLWISLLCIILIQYIIK